MFVVCAGFVVCWSLCLRRRASWLVFVRCSLFVAGCVWFTAVGCWLLSVCCLSIGRRRCMLPAVRWYRVLAACSLFVVRCCCLLSS